MVSPYFSPLPLRQCHLKLFIRHVLNEIYNNYRLLVFFRVSHSSINITTVQINIFWRGVIHLHLDLDFLRTAVDFWDM